MPPRIVEIANVIGIRQAIKFSLKYGGGQFFFPEKMEGSTIVDLLGYEDAEKLCRYLREHYDFRVEVPSSLTGKIFRRLQAIKLLREGRSYRAIAQEVGANRATVRRWYEDFVRHDVPGQGRPSAQASVKADLNVVERVTARSPSPCASAPETASGDQ